MATRRDAPTPVRSFTHAPAPAASALLVAVMLIASAGCASRTHNLGNFASKKDAKKVSDTTSITSDQLDEIFDMMTENRRRSWARSVLKDLGEAHEGTNEYYDNESEKVDWAGIKQCVGNDSRSAAGTPLSDLAHHYYCTLPGYLPAKRAANPDETRSSSALFRDRDWRLETAKTDKRMWLHTGIRACFTFSLRGEAITKDGVKTEYVRRQVIAAPDPENPGNPRMLTPVEHAFLYCLNDGRAANPDELDPAKREQIMTSYLSGKTAADLPKPFAFVAETQPEIFRMAMVPRATTAEIQKRLNAFYGIPATPKQGDCAKRPARDGAVEPQDGTHCLVGLEPAAE